MKGILIKPGKEPVVTPLPDTLQGIEALLRCPCEQKVLPRQILHRCRNSFRPSRNFWCATAA